MPSDKWIKRRYRHFVVYMISHSEKSKVCRCGNITLGDPSMTIPIQNKTQNITRKNVFTRHGKITFVGKSACRCGWGGRRLTGKVACVFSSPKLQKPLRVHVVVCCANVCYYWLLCLCWYSLMTVQTWACMTIWLSLIQYRVRCVRIWEANIATIHMFRGEVPRTVYEDNFHWFFVSWLCIYMILAVWLVSQVISLGAQRTPILRFRRKHRHCSCLLSDAHLDAGWLTFPPLLP